MMNRRFSVQALALLSILRGCGLYTGNTGNPLSANQPKIAQGPPSSVVFYSARDGNSKSQIYTMDSDGSSEARITFDVDAAADVDPDISPDGKQFVFTSNQTGNNDIFLLDRSNAILNLTNNTANDEWARWSPDGKQIVFDSNRNGGTYEVFLMNAEMKCSARTRAEIHQAAWQPSPAHFHNQDPLTVWRGIGTMCHTDAMRGDVHITFGRLIDIARDQSHMRASPDLREHYFFFVNPNQTRCAPKTGDRTY